MHIKSLVVAVTAVALTGCTTLSFAPPEVETQKRGDARSSSECGGPVTGKGEQILKDVDGALYLVDNFIAAYRCAAREAADGRQFFEVPSFLAIVTAAVGPSFGLGQNWRLGTATAGGVFAQANSYYAPKQKAKILDSALDALLCVKTEAVGAGYFDTRTTAPSLQDQADEKAIQRIDATTQNLRSLSATLDARIAGDKESLKQAKAARSNDDEARLTAEISARSEQVAGMRDLIDTLEAQRGSIISRLSMRQQSARLLALDDGGTIVIDPSRKYFEMVSAAALSIERVLGDRLSNAGSFDAAGISAQFKEIIEAQAKAAKDVGEAEGGAVNNGQPASVMKGLGGVSYSSDSAKMADIAGLKLDLLQTKLQACVVRAKIT